MSPSGRGTVIADTSGSPRHPDTKLRGVTLDSRGLLGSESGPTGPGPSPTVRRPGSHGQRTPTVTVPTGPARGWKGHRPQCAPGRVS